MGREALGVRLGGDAVVRRGEHEDALRGEQAGARERADDAEGVVVGLVLRIDLHARPEPPLLAGEIGERRERDDGDGKRETRLQRGQERREITAEAHAHDADRGGSAVEQVTDESAKVVHRLAAAFDGEARVGAGEGGSADAIGRPTERVEREHREDDVEAAADHPADGERALLERVRAAEVAVERDDGGARPRGEEEARVGGAVAHVSDVAFAELGDPRDMLARPRGVEDTGAAYLANADAQGMRRGGRGEEDFGRREEARLVVRAPDERERVEALCVRELTDAGRAALRPPRGRAGGRTIERGRGRAQPSNRERRGGSHCDQKVIIIPGMQALTVGSLARPFHVALGLFLALAALVLSAPDARALDRGADGWFHTGDGVRVKKVVFNFDVYAIGHDMKDLPPAKTKQAVIDMDTDKRFTWRMLRDVEHEKIQTALTEAFGMNGYSDQSKIGPFVGAFSGDFTKGQTVSIVYSSAAKTVTATVQGGGTATVSGADFMKAVWSIWFAKIDQPSLGDALIKNL
jgi:hypothetical protein